MTGIGRVVIVGAGQVGTMVGAALREAATACGISSIALYDSDWKVAEMSASLGGGDRVLRDPGAVLEADALVLAIPVGEIVAWLEEFGPRLGRGVLVLDTGSAKVEVVAAMAQFLPNFVRAVGGHPMVGSEASGPLAAVPGALRGAVFALCPCRSDEAALAAATQLVAACGARPLVVEATDHDRIVARTSHLPHLVASALAITAVGVGEDLALAQSLAGSGYLGTTRLAASDAQMVAAFTSSNRSQLELALRSFRAQLDRLEAALADGPRALALELGQARAARAQLLGQL